MRYICPVCKHSLDFTPYYNTKHGKVCEECYECAKGDTSDYSEYCQKLELAREKEIQPQ